MTAISNAQTAATARRRPVRRAAASLAIAGVFVVASLGMARAVVATTSGNTLRIEPAVGTVPEGGTFVAHVVQNAEVLTSGASATITFDPALLQIQSVARGAAYADAAVSAGSGAGAIAAANTSGSLVGVAFAYLPPDSVATGDADFLDVTFKAIGCGTVSLGLPTGETDAGLLDGRTDTYGATLPVTTTGATVALCNTLRIDPPVSTVPQDGTFTARIVQSAGVATSGASATVTFDPALLQIQSVARVGAYADSAIFNGASALAIAAANTSGSLVQVAAAFLPPDSVPAGDAGFLDITFKAIACGTSVLSLPTGPTDAGLLDGRTDTYGASLAVSTLSGSVTTCVAATPTPTPTGSPPPSPSPSPSTTPTATPNPTVTPTPALTPPPLPSGNSIRIEPFYTGVVKDGGFTVKVVQKATLPTSGAGATIIFDKTILQVVSVTKSAAYAAAPVVIGAGSSAIASANQTGHLGQIAVAFLTPTNIPVGEADAFIIEFKAIACGQSKLDLPVGPADGALSDGRVSTYGNPLTVQSRWGYIQACDPKASPTPKPTATPTITPYPTSTPGQTQPPTPQVTPPTTSAETLTPAPMATPSPDVTAAPRPTATPGKVAAVLAVSRPTPRPTTPAMTSVAFVGLGVAGVMAGLVIVLAMAMALVASLVIPLLVVRSRATRRQR